MKKILMTILALTMMVATTYAQTAVPATQVEKKNDLQTLLAPFLEKLEAIPEDGNEEEAAKNLAMEFVKENENEAGVYILTRLLSYMMPTDDLIKMVEGNQYFRENAIVKENMMNWRIKLETSEGKKFKDFSAEYEGKVTKLSDYVGKGKYVLVDFWASWCGPCRAEIPNLIKVYEQYKEKGLVVLGVAVNDKPEDTLKAIEKDKITYPQILNSQNIAAETYDFNSIPTIYLFGPDGRVVAHDLRGKDINNKLAEIFQ